MKIVAALAIALLLGTRVAIAAPPADLDSFVEKAMRRFEVPGMMLTIVERDSTTLARGYGVRKLGRPERVDEHTLFEIGSCSKAFVSAALATLVDKGELRWDDKLIDRLPGFRMFDSFATLEMTVADMLVHNSGLSLGAGDLMFFPPTTFTREDVVQRLRFLKPPRSFRSGYAYDNVLYIAAERLVEHVSGLPWERFARERLFVPLGMNETVASPYELRNDNFGWPHARIDGEMRGVGTVEPLHLGETFGKPSKAPLTGTIMASAADMARWLRVQLNSGSIGPAQGRLFSEDAAREMWEPRTLVPITPMPSAIAATAPNFQAYAFGWFVRDYRGHKIVTHSGSVDGFLAAVAIIPDRRVAFSIAINSEDGEARWAVYYRLLDHYLGLPREDWIEAYAQARKERIEKALAELRKPFEEVRGPGPSLPLEQYTGRYEDAWYGTITISSPTKERPGLWISFDRAIDMQGPLEHVSRDMFRTRFTDRSIEDAYVTFSLKGDGTIDRITMQAVSPLADFSFDYHDLLFRPVASHESIGGTQ